MEDDCCVVKDDGGMGVAFIEAKPMVGEGWRLESCSLACAAVVAGGCLLGRCMVGACA